jgi:hypothetical protein
MPAPGPDGMIEVVFNVTGGEHQELVEAVDQVRNIIKDKDDRRIAYRLAHGPFNELLSFVKAARRVTKFAEQAVGEPESI